MRRALVLFSLVAAIPSPAQTTHLVGAGGFATLQAAFAAASPGDAVIVQPGTFTLFILDKGLTVRAETPGTVTITGFLPALTIPAGQVAHMVGLDFTSLAVIRGRATFDGCTFTNGGSPLVVGGAVGPVDVHLQNCLVRAQTFVLFTAAPACEVADAWVTAVDSQFLGADGTQTTPPGSAIRLTNATLAASSCTVRGGLGTPGTPALAADAGSTVWLADCDLIADPSACTTNAMHGHLDRCTLQPNCTTLPNAFTLGVSRPQPLAAGQPFALAFHTQPNGVVVVLASAGLDRASLSGIEQPDLLAAAGCFAAGLLVADAAGLTNHTWNVPAGPFFAGTALWFQGFGLPFPLQASPVVGGIVR